MNKKQAYIDVWKARFEALESSLKAAVADAKLTAAKTQSELNDEREYRLKKEAWHAKLNELSLASEEKWEEFKADVEKSWLDLEKSYYRWKSKHIL